MAEPSNTNLQQPGVQPRKLVITVPEELLSTLRTTCAAKADVSLLGRIQGKHPGLKALTAWARDTLHSSFAFLSLKSNNLFEVTFTNPEGRIHALTQTELTCESTAISFSSWRPHFDPKTLQPEDQLDYPVWVQIVDLCQILREESFLRTIGEQMGQVITIDSSEAYRAKLFGPRIRILVRSLYDLPQSIVLPRLDREGTVEYKLEYSGLPNQCGRCRSRDHQVRHCPKKESKQRRIQPTTDKPAQDDEATTLQKTETHTDSSEQVTQVQAHAPPGADILIPAQPEPETSPPPQTEASIQPEPTLEPNDINFPQLSPNPVTPVKETIENVSFVWKPKALEEASTQDRGKGKSQQAGAESTPLTRQGYRSGRLAEDFWKVLGTPNTPPSSRKRLKVIPFITKNTDQSEYLVNKAKSSPMSITEVNVAEVLAGIPWTKSRAQQHVVNEVAQALHKILMFNNNNNSPFQKWAQGKWFANWTSALEGEHTCTLYVCVAVPESKVKIRKGRDIGWRRIPERIRAILAAPDTEHIQEAAEQTTHWQEMAGPNETWTIKPQPTGLSPNRYAVLSEEETPSS